VLQIFNYALCLILIIIGLIGCSFETPSEYLGGEKVLTSIVMFFAILAAYLLVYALKNFVQCECLSFAAILIKGILAATIAYGLYQALNKWQTKVENITDILLYLSVVYLMGRTPPFDEFGRRVVTELTALPIFASVVIVLFTSLVIIEVERIGFSFYFDNFEVIRMCYAIVALLGLCCFGNGVAFVSCIIITVLDFYALFTILQFLKSLMVN